MKRKKPVAPRGDYVPPKIVHTEKVETLAVDSAKDDDPQCGPGTIDR